MQERFAWFLDEARSSGPRRYLPVITIEKNGKGVIDIDTVKGCTLGMSGPSQWRMLRRMLRGQDGQAVRDRLRAECQPPVHGPRTSEMRSSRSC